MIKFSLPLNTKLVFDEDLEPSILLLTPHKKHLFFYYSGHSKLVNSFYFHVTLISEPPPFC